MGSSPYATSPCLKTSFPEPAQESPCVRPSRIHFFVGLNRVISVLTTHCGPEDQMQNITSDENNYSPVVYSGQSRRPPQRGHTLKLAAGTEYPHPSHFVSQLTLRLSETSS